MISLLSQQAVQHPGKHADVLAQIESRLAKHRTFYASLRDANEETPEVPPSGQLKRGDAPVQPVSLDYLIAGFPSFLRLLDPGCPPVEAAR